ncbi:MAG: M14 family metallopeptidase [Clostridia bacterium]|nr:M14 family metallopeptidase [Clostridia bacterium]
MKKSVIYKIDSLYRDDFRITGYTFGEGEKALCIVGSIRGNEIQQIYTCSRMIQTLKKLEVDGMIAKGKQILVIPACNPYSINIEKRFWPTDNTDINRMFPGYALGETTQRIAAGIFDVVKEYKNGIQLASFYMPGEFMPHVRMMTTGFENTELAKKFGLPYIVLRNTRPYDTTTLNYNWQIWETNAFSLYTTGTYNIDREGAEKGRQAMLNFMINEGILLGDETENVVSSTISDEELISVRAAKAGLFERYVKTGRFVQKGELMARVLDPYDGEVRHVVHAPESGVVFFAYNQPMTYANTAVFKLIPEDKTV